MGKVIRTLAYHHGRKRRCKGLKQELEYFRHNRPRIAYARLRAENLSARAWSTLPARL